MGRGPALFRGTVLVLFYVHIRASIHGLKRACGAGWVGERPVVELGVRACRRASVEKSIRMGETHGEGNRGMA